MRENVILKVWRSFCDGPGAMIAETTKGAASTAPFCNCLVSGSGRGADGPLRHDLDQLGSIGRISVDIRQKPFRRDLDAINGSGREIRRQRGLETCVSEDAVLTRTRYGDAHPEPVSTT